MYVCRRKHRIVVNVDGSGIRAFVLSRWRKCEKLSGTGSWDISSENTAAVFFSAAIRAIFNAKGVLPIPGRAAKRIRPGIFKPEIFSKIPSVFIQFLRD